MTELGHNEFRIEYGFDENGPYADLSCYATVDADGNICDYMAKIPQETESIAAVCQWKGTTNLKELLRMVAEHRQETVQLPVPEWHDMRTVEEKAAEEAHGMMVGIELEIDGMSGEG